MATTWNPSDKSANITLSAGDLTATKTAGGAAWASARSTTSRTSGKYYFEATVSGTEWTMGVANSSASTASFIGGDANGIGWYRTDGTTKGAIYVNNAVQSTSVSPYATGNTIQIAVDLTDKKLWAKRSTDGTWNDGTGDPVAGTGGHSFTFSGAFYAGVSVYAQATPDALTVNFGASAFAGSPPSGFYAWDANYALSAAVGAFTLTGVAAGLRAVRLLVTAAAAFVLTGVAATVKRLLPNLTAGTGSFVVRLRDPATRANPLSTRSVTASPLAAGSATASPLSGRTVQADPL